MYIGNALQLPWADFPLLAPRSPIPRVPRIFVIDDDELFCRQLQRVGRKLNISVRWFHPERDFARLPQDGEYDAAIIDYDLGSLLGTQVSTLYRETPVLLVSIKDRTRQDPTHWPPSIQAFVAKKVGAPSILNQAVRLGREADDDL